MTSSNGRFERAAHLRWVPIEKMATSAEQADRYNQARVDHIVADIDLEQIGAPVVSYRDSIYWIIDGQHRIAALKAIGWGDQQVQCWAYEGLTEAEESERFLKLNDYLVVGAITKFRVGVKAGRTVECDINRIVLSQGLNISRDKLPGSIGAIGTVRRIYDRGGPTVLRQTLATVRDTYGDPGMEAAILDGIGYLVQRYAGELDLSRVVTKLSAIHGGVHGLLGRAENIRKVTGNAKGQCVAAAAVDVINAGRGGKKLAPWWRLDERASLTAVSA